MFGISSLAYVLYINFGNIKHIHINDEKIENAFYAVYIHLYYSDILFMSLFSNYIG